MTATPPRVHQGRQPLRGRVALRLGALVAIAACAGIAHGQVAFRGTPTTTAGSVTYGTSGNATDVITLGSHSAIIDWTPTDTRGTGTIDFLPAGGTAIFQSGSDAGFTVLNRINPANTSRAVQFDGHVISQYVDAAGTASRAGNVWFYTPGGIVVGASGVFDVGSLILTTNAIDTANGVPTPGSGIRFAGAAGSLATVTVQPGAQINATTAGSYVALVAPRIAQGGTVTVNGSVGYVAAEAADITINAGLFTITNTIGSQVAAGGETTLTHTGTTTGPAATDTAAPHSIYMVAIPKNDAVTMLVAGSTGYQAATSASVVNGSIVLGAGYTSSDATATPVAVGGGQASAIALQGNYTSGVSATASGAVSAGSFTTPGAVALTSTGGTVTLGDIGAGNATTGGGITLSGASGVAAGSLLATDSVSVTSGAGPVTLANVTSSGGTARITASGAMLTGDVTAAGSVYLTGGAAITAGNLKAGVGTLRAGQSGGTTTGGGTDAAPSGIAPGFDTATVASCDDCSTATIALPFDVNYFGNDYTGTYISNNGYFTFASGQGTYTPSGLGTGYSGQAIIAAFFADVDTRGAGTVTYGNGTYAGRQAFGATWNGVGYYSAGTDKLNNFQIVLTNRADTGAGNFDIYYNYGAIGWETGSASGGSGGLGGTSAAVGYNAGTGNQAGTFFQLPGSLVPGSFINGGTAPLVTTSNDGNAGQLLFSVRNGQVVTGTPAAPPAVHVTNIAAGNSADVRLGNISGEAAEVHGAGHVTVGAVTVADQHSGATAPGNPFATVLDSATGLIAGDISSAGLVALGATGGDISTGSINSASSVVVLGNGAVSLGAVTTGQSAGDTLFVSGTGGAPAGFDFATLLSGTSFAPATLAAATPVATGGDVRIGVVSVGNARIASGAAIVTDRIVASGPVALNAAGDIMLGGSVAAARLGATANGSFTSGAINTTGDTAITAGNVTVGAVSAGGTLAITGNGALALQGDADGVTVALASHAVSASGQIGSSRTTALSFTNSGSGGTYVGAAGAGSGDYSLSAAALANSHGAAISILAPGTGGMVIGDVALTGANLVGSGGTLTFNAAGTLQLTGRLAVSGIGAGNGVSLVSGQAISGVLPASGISLTDASGGLAGTLSLQADRIAFATPAAAQAVAAATTLADRSDALAVSDGATVPGSYIQAAAVKFTVGSALYTQNGGIVSTRNDDRAGVTAGAGGISLASLGTTPVEVVLNARLAGATGEVTGHDVVDQLQLGGETPLVFAPQSTVNGCLTDGTPCAVPIAILEQQIQPVQDVVQQLALPSGIGQSSGYTFQNPQLVSMVGLAPAALAPLIDEPVTGAGNDNLWVGVGVGGDGPLAPMGGAKSGKTTLPR